MARGKAVDSNASGSGPCRGHCRGRSTRGRGGPIPPPSSSSMSGASSSALPPIPPPLPSIPSSSIPFPGLAESSPASPSPTAPKAFHMGRGYYGYAKSSLGEIVRSTAEKYDREPTRIEVFTYTHTKDHDGNTFVDRHALGVNPDHSIDEISALQARVDEQERQLAELRAHVMRMYGHHGASTSSSDPPSAIDPHVFITLHQPRSSPLDPDTADDTLVTPVDTTTHPTHTTINPVHTTLDRPEDRHHRFDFEPF
ncbi:hypothetical protein JCGZ_25686 [Jatropha curcas]|uniref:Uncharacterized protein n=1 Tax=Jatropha curcas TaxID=180498 RepID=A0A067LFJ3_JATCU|nr:hypothetical protein JCGZ_25686 [Jatropha curcas]